MRGRVTATPGTSVARRQSDLIREGASRNIHLGVRLARAIGLELNLFVSFNFSLTSCDPKCADLAFAKLRAAFGKWATRPSQNFMTTKVPPTFVWVIENPNECLNAHWLVHVPVERQAEFRQNLGKWFKNAFGDVYSDRAVNVKTITNADGLKAYLLKGLHPSLAKRFGISHVYQGWVHGRRAGHSRNIGPMQVKRWRRLKVFPPAQRWITCPTKTAIIL